MKLSTSTKFAVLGNFVVIYLAFFKRIYTHFGIVAFDYLGVKIKLIYENIETWCFLKKWLYFCTNYNQSVT
jgi:hypothetical protein